MAESLISKMYNQPRETLAHAATRVAKVGGSVLLICGLAACAGIGGPGDYQADSVCSSAQGFQRAAQQYSLDNGGRSLQGDLASFGWTGDRLQAAFSDADIYHPDGTVRILPFDADGHPVMYIDYGAGSGNINYRGGSTDYDHYLEWTHALGPGDSFAKARRAGHRINGDALRQGADIYVRGPLGPSGGPC